MHYVQYCMYFTEKFWRDHLYASEERGKRHAEEVFQRRDVSVSSVLQVTRHSIRVLVGEVKRRQGEYRANPRELFVSEPSFEYWERKGKRARRLGPAKFRYAVKHEDGVYKIHHFDGVV
jgi:hypothetical protein